MANGTLAASQIEMLSLSGTGIITITPPATNTNRAITLPDAAGAIVVSGTTPSLNGITFPATQVASADANTLDDYEEGTWTPNQGNGLTVVGAFSSSGTYTKVGRQVTVLFTIAGATTIAITAGAQITGNLPFTAAASMDNAGTIYRFGATGGECIAGGSQVNAFSGATIAAGGGLNISITYFV